MVDGLLITHEDQCDGRLKLINRSKIERRDRQLVTSINGLLPGNGRKIIAIAASATFAHSC